MSRPWQDLTRLVNDQRSRLRVRKARNRLREDAIRHAIEHVVDLANPRIRGLNGYRRLLREPIARCLDYSEELARRVPGPGAVQPADLGAGRPAQLTVQRPWPHPLGGLQNRLSRLHG